MQENVQTVEAPASLPISRSVPLVILARSRSQRQRRGRRGSNGPAGRLFFFLPQGAIELWLPLGRDQVYAEAVELSASLSSRGDGETEPRANKTDIQKHWPRTATTLAVRAAPLPTCSGPGPAIHNG